MTSESEDAGKLIQDQLYGTNATIKVLSYWRMTFYGHLLNLYGLSPELSPAADGIPPSARLPIMNEVVDLAKATTATLDENKVEIFPRDRFILTAAKPLVRYDIAFLKALQDEHQGLLADTENNPLATVRPRVKAIVEQIATAELEVVNIAPSKTGEDFWVMTRYSILRTAIVVARKAKLKEEDRAREHPILAARSRAFVDAARADSGSADERIRRVLRRLGLTKLDKDELGKYLPYWGLAAVP